MTALAVLLALVGCKSNSKKTAETVQPRKSVVVYYSQTGGTEKVAKEFARQLGLDTLIRIEVDNPYDGSYEETIDRCKKEMESGEIPTLKAPGIRSDAVRHCLSRLSDLVRHLCAADQGFR
jgi:hypothetical protein